MAAIMWNHAPKMWAKMAEREIPISTFANNEMADVIVYLSLLAYSDEPADRIRGQKMLDQKGCLRCHAVRGDGGDEGPGLAAEEEENRACWVGDGDLEPCAQNGEGIYKASDSMAELCRHGDGRSRRLYYRGAT